MTIQFTCPECGKRYKVADAAAGKRVKCKGCDHPVRIPIKEPVESEEDVLDGCGSKQRKAASPNRPLLVGIGAVALLLVVGVVFLLLRGGPGEGQQPADEQVAASDVSGDQEGTATTVSASGKDKAAASASSAARRYPSFPNAVTEPPAWIGPHAPFDVDKFFEGPPPGQNAAPLYLDALFEFGSILSYCYCPSGERPQGETKRRADAADQRSREHDRLNQAWRKDPSSVDNAATDVWLAEYETGFEKLALAQQRPECVFETGIGIVAFLLHVQVARQVARVVEWRTRRDLARGDVERPVRDVEMLLRLSRDLQPRGEMICQLVSVAMDTICCQEVVPQILRADGVEKKHCDRLLAVLGRHDAGSRLRFRRGVQAEYLTARKALHDFQHHTGDFRPQFMKRLGYRDTPLADTPLGGLKVLVAFKAGGKGPLAKEKYGKGAAGLTPDHPFVAGWTVNGKLMSDDDFAKEVDALNRVYASILDLADQTARERLHVSWDAALVEPLRDTNVALLFEPSEPRWNALNRGFLSSETQLRGTKCLIALRRWQLDHDGPPPDLETLVKAAGMSEIPTDPYSDRPLLMTTLDGRPVIYSVGPDGKDDRALVEWNLRTKNPTGDWLFRLPVPQTESKPGMAKPEPAAEKEALPKCRIGR